MKKLARFSSKKNESKSQGSVSGKAQSRTPNRNSSRNSPNRNSVHSPPQNTVKMLGGGQISFPKNWRQVAGHHAITELIKVRPKSIKYLLIQNNWATSNDLRNLMELVKSYNLNIEEKSDSDLQKICPSHQGAVAFSDHHLAFDYTQSKNGKSLVLALDGVEDPHNLGAIMRTSWLMSVNGIIVPADRAVGLTATVHKVACGGVEHVPLLTTNNFKDPFDKLKDNGHWVFGMSHKAKKTIYDLKIPDKIVWVMGAEDKGLRITTERACDELVSIPQAAVDASYNVSVATALALAETKRQWGV